MCREINVYNVKGGEDDEFTTLRLAYELKSIEAENINIRMTKKSSQKQFYNKHPTTLQNWRSYNTKILERGLGKSGRCELGSANIGWDRNTTRLESWIESVLHSALHRNLIIQIRRNS